MSDDRERRIAARAHEIWMREGSPDGHAQEHWQQAEREIDAEAPEEGLDLEQPAGKPAKGRARPARAQGA